MKLHWFAIVVFLLYLQQKWVFGKGGDAFIRRKGCHFMLNATPFYANGFNAYWLMYQASDHSQRPKVTAAFRQATAHGLTVARTWAFSDGGDRPLQNQPGIYDQEMFKGLDFVVAEARRFGIKLILSLANNYDSFGGKKQYVTWARSRGQRLICDDDFFTNSLTKGWYKDHVRTVLNRKNTVNGIIYRNDPTIMAWELMNEARCTSDPTGTTIQTWIAEMASYVKSIDRNHLLEAGIEGFYGQSSPWRSRLNPVSNIGTDFIGNNRIEDIDFATVHSYPDQWLSKSSDANEVSFMSQWLDAHIQDAERILRKPILIAEFGKSWKDAGFSAHQRDVLFNTVYNKIYTSANHGGAAAGGLFWQLLGPAMDSFGDGYEIILDQNSSTANIIAFQAHKMHQISKKKSRTRH